MTDWTCSTRRMPHPGRLQSTRAPLAAEVGREEDQRRGRGAPGVETPAAGQSCVIYDGDKVAGGGIIDKSV